MIPAGGLAEMLTGLRSEPVASMVGEGGEELPLLTPAMGALPPLTMLRPRRQASSSSNSARELEVKRGRTEEDQRAAEEKLAKVYESFRFEKLWAQLSEALARLQGDPSSAQVLLPVIEVCAALLPRGGLLRV